eukprot:1177282-Prorocentrum_minimum.AAC.2
MCAHDGGGLGVEVLVGGHVPNPEGVVVEVDLQSFGAVYSSDGRRGLRRLLPRLVLLRLPLQNPLQLRLPVQTGRLRNNNLPLFRRLAPEGSRLQPSGRIGGEFVKAQRPFRRTLARGEKLGRGGGLLVVQLSFRRRLFLVRCSRRSPRERRKRRPGSAVAVDAGPVVRVVRIGPCHEHSRGGSAPLPSQPHTPTGESHAEHCGSTNAPGSQAAVNLCLRWTRAFVPKACL